MLHSNFKFKFYKTVRKYLTYQNFIHLKHHSIATLRIYLHIIFKHQTSKILQCEWNLCKIFYIHIAKKLRKWRILKTVNSASAQKIASINLVMLIKFYFIIYHKVKVTHFKTTVNIKNCKEIYLLQFLVRSSYFLWNTDII